MTIPNEGPRLALIIPVYNESNSIQDHYAEIRRILEGDGIPFRVLFVDDGSTDNTWAILCDLSVTYENVFAIRFARNFGKEVALCAGLDTFDADLYITMDSDLQHPPRYIRKMLEMMETERAEIVEGVKIHRGRESLKYRLIAKSFYRFLKAISGLDMDNSSDFKLMDRRVVDTLRQFHERHLFFRGEVGWVGFKAVKMPFEVDDRAQGNSHFSTRKLIMLAMDALLSYSSKPLYLTTLGGLVFLVFAIILGIQTLMNYASGSAVSGFTTVILLLLITGSAIMISLGIIGAYISRIYDEIKGRPRYVVAEKTPE